MEAQSVLTGHGSIPIHKAELRVKLGRGDVIALSVLTQSFRL